MALVVVSADQISKHLVEQNLTLGTPVPVLGDVLTFLYVLNPGAAFSIATGYTWIFSIAAAAVIVFIVVFAGRIRSMAWAILFGMLLGGTLGNLIDRLFREPGFGVGHVVDFIQVIYFPAIFNIADCFIVSSMGLFIILTIRGVGLDGQRATAAATAGPAVDDSPALDDRPARDGGPALDGPIDDDRPAGDGPHGVRSAEPGGDGPARQ